MENKNIDVFFALVRAGLWEEEVRLSAFDTMDWEVIYRIAEEQSVMGIVAAGIEFVVDEKAPQAIKLKFIGQALQIEQCNKEMNHFVMVLIDKLRTKGIYTLLLKGQGVAQCYERPLWRACGDVDLFLSNDNYQKAKEFLLSMSSSAEHEYPTSKHLAMTIDSWEVEIHGHLRSTISPRINKELCEIEKQTFYEGNVRSWLNNEVQVFLLGAENDVIFVFVHFLNHFYKGGIGLRQICDWCRLLWTFRRTLNKESLESRVKEMGMMSEWRAFAAFAVEYLGMPSEVMPMYTPDVKWKRKADKIWAFIMKVGNFGHKRDMSYYQNYPYLNRKVISLCRRCSDIIKHLRIFPFDSLRFFPYIMMNGFRSALRGE